jgi:hypothetical protein
MNPLNSIINFTELIIDKTSKLIQEIDIDEENKG